MRGIHEVSKIGGFVRNGSSFTVEDVHPRWIASSDGLVCWGNEIVAVGEGGCRLFIPVKQGRPLPEVGDTIVWTDES